MIERLSQVKNGKPWQLWFGKPWWLLVVASLLGLVWRIRILGSDADAILARFGSDDMFYYTQVAHHWLISGLPSLDGVNVTNGFQPLFALLLLPFAKGFAGDPLWAIQLNLGLVTLLTLAIGWSLPGMMRLFLGRERGHWAGVAMGCLWLLHPRLLEVTFQGTEAALAALCWIWAIRWWARRQHSRGTALGLGLVLGLGCLARIDQVFLAGCLMLWPFEWGGWRNKLPFCILGWLLVVMPWVIFSIVFTGTPLQDSGQAKRLQYQHVRQQALASEANQQTTPKWRKNVSYQLARAWQLPRPLWQTAGQTSKISLLGWLAMVVWLAWAKFRNRDGLASFLKWAGDAGPALIASVGIVTFYWVMFGYLRVWYYVPLFWALSMIATVAWAQVLEPEKNLRRGMLFSGVIVLWLLGAFWEWQRVDRFRWEPIYLAAAQDLQNRTPPGAKIGAFNAGIQAGATVQNRTVTNLDGVANHPGRLALEKNQLTQYLDQSGIDYLIDHRGAIAFYESLGAKGLSNRLTLVAIYEVAERPEQEICLWRIQGR